MGNGSSRAGKMSWPVPWYVVSVRVVEHGVIAVEFRDGRAGIVDMRPRLSQDKPKGLFSGLKDQALFARVQVEAGAVGWPNAIELAPDAMYDAIKAGGVWTLD